MIFLGEKFKLPGYVPNQPGNKPQGGGDQPRPQQPAIQQPQQGGGQQQGQQREYNPMKELGRLNYELTKSPELRAQAAAKYPELFSAPVPADAIDVTPGDDGGDDADDDSNDTGDGYTGDNSGDDGGDDAPDDNAA